MIDWYVLLAPIFLFGVIALLGFVGCNWLYGLDETKVKPKPDPPSNFQAVAGDNKVSLTWDPDPEADVTGYTVFRGITPGTVKGDYDPGVALSPSQLPYTDVTAKNGTKYYYRVTASNSAGESGLSDEQSAVPVSPFGSFITGIATPGTPNAMGRTNWFGMAVHVVGPGAITIQKLGRAFDLGMTTPHQIRIVNAATKKELGSTSVDMTSGTGGFGGGFKYGDLNPPVMLAAGSDFYVLSEEFNGGDRFYEQDTAVATRLEARIMSAMESDPQGVVFIPAGGIGHTYGPVDFQY
jgi:fibronectin type III domain protein